MYVALASPPEDDRHGTTKLHLDVTDAVNILTWSSGAPSDCAAIWDIVPFQALPALRKFLRNTGLHIGAEDPIHAQKIFLTNEMIQQFTARHKFPIWRIHQRLGDAVFVPAGCAHQVSMHFYQLTTCGSLTCRRCGTFKMLLRWLATFFLLRT